MKSPAQNLGSVWDFLLMERLKTFLKVFDRKI